MQIKLDVISEMFLPDPQNSIQQVFFLKRIKSAFCHSFSQRDKAKVKGRNSSLAHHQTVANANAGASGRRRLRR